MLSSWKSAGGNHTSSLLSLLKKYPEFLLDTSYVCFELPQRFDDILLVSEAE